MKLYFTSNRRYERKAIIDVQGQFFQGTGELEADVKLFGYCRNGLDIHESTVSRAVREKYMQCLLGSLSAKLFLFSKGIAASTAFLPAWDTGGRKAYYP